MRITSGRAMRRQSSSYKPSGRSASTTSIRPTIRARSRTYGPPPSMGLSRGDGMNEQGQWQVAGSAPEVYERELVPAIFGPWVPIVIDLAHPRPGDRVLDV